MMNKYKSSRQKTMGLLCNIKNSHKLAYALILLYDGTNGKLNFEDFKNSFESLKKHKTRTFDVIEEVYSTLFVVEDEEAKEFTKIVEELGNYYKTSKKNRKPTQGVFF